MKLIYEIIKNLKIIMRDWASVVLLILGPLILILLIGYIFSSEDVHGIKIGVFATEETSIISEMQENLEDIGEIIQYSNANDCVQDLQRGKNHVCINVSSKMDAKKGDVPGGIFIMYSDNSRQMISGVIQAQIKFLVDSSSEDISVESTESLLETIQGIVSSLGEKRKVLNTFTKEISGLTKITKEQLASLRNFQKTFKSRQAELIQIEESLKNESFDVKPAIQIVEEQIITLEQTNKEIRDLAKFYENNLDAFNTDADNLKSEIKTINQQNAVLLQQSINEQIDTITSTTGLTEDMFIPITNQVNSAVANIDEVNSMLDEIDYTSEDATIRISEAISASESASGALEEMLMNLRDQTKEIEVKIESYQSELGQITGGFNKIIAIIETEISRAESGINQLEKVTQVLELISTGFDEDLEKLAIFSPTVAEDIIRPIVRETSPLQRFRNIDIIYPVLTVLIIIFITTLFANIIALEEINSQAHFRNLITPTNNLVFLLGIFFTNLIIVLFQITIFFLVTQYQFNIDVFSVLGEMYFGAILLMTFFTLIGISIAYLIVKEQTSILITTLIALGFYLISSALFPVEFMPIEGAKLAILNPISIGERLFRVLVLYDISIFDSTKELYMMGAYILVAFAVAVIANKHFVKKLQ